MSAGPLQGYKVVEMAGLAPGPFAAMMLADMGAQVLRVERSGDVQGPASLQFLNRSRRSIALDLKSEVGRALFKRLLARSDALIEGFRPGVMERLGLGPTECLALNPRLVYGRMTGWGQDGPLANSPGHDINYIALAGVLESMGEADRVPMPPLNLAGDFGGGGIYLAFGIVCALLEAQRSGQGQVVDAAMVDGAASLMTYFYAHLAQGRWPGRGQAVTAGAAPYYGVYRTCDNRFVSVGAAEPKFYEELVRELGLADQPLPHRSDRANWPTLRTAFEAAFLTKTQSEWCAQLERAEVCFAPVLSMEEAVAHPHNVARETFVQVGGHWQPSPAPRFTRTRTDPPHAGVEAGVDAQAALLGWGLDRLEIAALVESGDLK